MVALSAFSARYGWQSPSRRQLALEVGSYTREPVQTQFGWHVIKVEDRQNRQPPHSRSEEQIRSVLFRTPAGP